MPSTRSLKPNATAHSTAAYAPPADLSAIVVTEANVPTPYSVYRTLTGIEALDASDTAPVGLGGFSDALLTEFDDNDEHEGEHEGRYRTFAAAFATADDALLAFEAAVANYEAPAGWGQTRLLPFHLGNQGVQFDTGAEYGFPRLTVYLWRVDSVLMQAVEFHPYERRRTDLLLHIAEGMATRASGE